MRGRVGTLARHLLGGRTTKLLQPCHRQLTVSWRNAHPCANAPLWITPPHPCRNDQIRMVHRIANASTRDMAEIEDRVWSFVGTSVTDPILGKNLQDLGWMNRRLAVSADGTVQILLKVPTLLHPALEELKQKVKVAAEKEIHAWASERGISEALQTPVNVEALAMTPLPFMAQRLEDPTEIDTRLGPGLAKVSHFLAVYSCKGGVGKSTVAVNLAYELARLEGRVGLLDLDVYGPSLPLLVHPDDPAVRRSPLGSAMVYPIEHKGVKMLSLGFVSSKSGVAGSGQDGGAAVLRGPMAGKVVSQLLKGTDWGELDVLVLDLPPGTGDVQLTLCQDIDLSGAVGVTTPSKLAIADARKGIEMFSELGVPTLAMVENMSYFECPGGEKHYPFGKGFQAFLDSDNYLKELHRDNICQLPISSAANDANDVGIPLSLGRPDSATRELNALGQLATIVSRELFKLPYQVDDASSMEQVSFEGSESLFNLSSVHLALNNNTLVMRVFSESGGFQTRFSPHELRIRDPKTGKVSTDQSDTNSASTSKAMSMVQTHTADSIKTASKDIPRHVGKKGRVGFEVTWGDGAKYIYSRRAIVLAAGGKVIR